MKGHPAGYPEQRATPAGFSERMRWAAMVAAALRMGQRLAAGLDLWPGDRRRKARFPAEVREAVDAAARPASRYLPAAHARYLRAATKALQEDRAVAPAEWSERLVAVRQLRSMSGWSKELAAKLSREEDKLRYVTIAPPRNVAGAACVRSAIARAAGISPHTLRAWEREYARQPFTMAPPPGFPGAARIRSAMARAAGISVQTLEAWERANGRKPVAHKEWVAWLAEMNPRRGKRRR